jgi:ketosteroid isomerase-like protein
MALHDRHQIEAVIRRYYDGCNNADADLITSCLADDATHYFPRGAPQGPFVGATAVAQGWLGAVKALGSRWTIDRLIVDEAVGEAAVEWTHFKPAAGRYLRGSELISVNGQGRIAEIRAYYACPPPDSDESSELGGFDYAGRGYPLVAPAVATNLQDLAPDVP